MIGTAGMVIVFVTLATTLVELSRQQLPFGKDPVRAWMLGTPQSVARELQDNGTFNAGIGVGWEAYTLPGDPSPPSGIPFAIESALGCLFRDPNYPTHSGVDFPIGLGTPVVTTMAGKVVWAATNGPWGNLVVVENNGYQIYFAHLSSFSVVKGEVLSNGAEIGKAGSTGNSTGNHLHYGIKAKMKQGASWVDPLGFFNGGAYRKVPCR